MSVPSDEKMKLLGSVHPVFLSQSCSIVGITGAVVLAGQMSFGIVVSEVVWKVSLALHCFSLSGTLTENLQFLIPIFRFWFLSLSSSKRDSVDDAGG